MKIFRGFSKFLVIALTSSFILYPTSVLAAGLGVRVLPGASDSPLGGNTRLWFAVPKGQSDSRKIEIINRGPEDLRIKLELLNAIERDGKLVLEEKLSPLNEYFSPSDNNFKMKASTSRVVTLKISSESESSLGEQIALLAISGNSDEKIKSSRSEGTKVVGENILRFTIPIYVVIGSGDSWNVDFEIDKIVDLTLEDKKILDIYFYNNGDLPLGLKGKVEFASSEFEDLSFGPYSFGSEAIAPKNAGRARVELPSDFVPGKYKVLVAARQSNVEKTRVFEEDLTFPGSDTSSWVWWILMLAVIFLLYVSYLALRRKLQNVEQSES